MIYDKVKELCKIKGISVREVEQEAGLGNGTISKWNTSKPMIDKIQAVAKALDVELDELLN